MALITLGPFIFFAGLSPRAEESLYFCTSGRGEVLLESRKLPLERSPLRGRAASHSCFNRKHSLL